MQVLFPLIAIQLSALKVSDQIVLNFVRVLDRVGLRHDDEVDAGGETDREYWNGRANPATIGIADRMLQEINKKAKLPLHLNFLKHYIGLSDGTKSRNFVYFLPRKQYTYAYANVADAPAMAQKLQDAALEAGVDKYNGFVWVTVKPKEYEDNLPLLSELMREAISNYEAG